MSNPNDTWGELTDGKTMHMIKQAMKQVIAANELLSMAKAELGRGKRKASVERALSARDKLTKASSLISDITGRVTYPDAYTSIDKQDLGAIVEAESEGKAVRRRYISWDSSNNRPVYDNMDD